MPSLQAESAAANPTIKNPDRLPSTWRVLGIEDSDGDRCECCGTPCPKRRVVLRPADGGEDRRFGSMCAAMALRGVRDAKAARHIERDARAIQRERIDRQQREESGRFMAFVADASDKPTHYERLQELGGFGEARRKYRNAAAIGGGL